MTQYDLRSFVYDEKMWKESNEEERSGVVKLVSPEIVLDFFHVSEIR